MMLKGSLLLVAATVATLQSATASAAADGGSSASDRKILAKKSKHLKRAAPDLTFNTVSSSVPTNVAGQSFDYVVVGGGTAALAVAKRLAEANGNTTVAVIEAGSTGEEVAERILAPAMAYYNGVAYPGSDYDWGYYTSNQTDLGNRPVFWPRGKVLGGSSAVNGAYMTRASKNEHDVWAKVNNGTAWNFDSILPYYIKHETFEAPTAEYSKSAGGIVVDQQNHGYDGPIHYARAGYLFDQIGEWIPTFANLGIPTGDPASGVTTGAYLSTSAIRGSDQTRSYSHSGYLANVPSNLVVLTGYQVTKINFDTTGGKIVATGVNFQASENSDSYTVTANKEVILSAGVIGSPQLLQLSGVGPASLLSGLGIEVVHDLPGVGQHLQDHLSTSLTFSTTADVTGDLLKSNATFNQAQLSAWTSGNGNQSLYSAPNEAIAYLNITTLLGSDAAASYISQLRANLTSMVKQYNSEATVAAGYRATYNAEIDYLLEGGDGEVELLMTNTGYNGGKSGKTIILQFALQHPFSRGAVQITSASPFVMPSVDPGYLTHPGDIQIIRETMRYLRKVAQTAPLSNILGDEIAPGAAVSSDDDIDSFLRSSLGTEYHPAGSCSMLPLAYGGCVDTEMKVHGISNLRVIDSSVIPVGFAAHLASPTYALAEKGAAIILGTDNVQGSSSSGNATKTSTGTASSATAGVGNNANGDSSNSDAAATKPTGSAHVTSMSSSLSVLLATVLVVVLLA